MITPENFEATLASYKSFKAMIKQSNLSRKDILEHLSKETELGEQIVDFVNSISRDEEEFHMNLEDFIKKTTSEE